MRGLKYLLTCHNNTYSFGIRYNGYLYKVFKLYVFSLLAEKLLPIIYFYIFIVFDMRVTKYEIFGLNILLNEG